MTAIATAAAPTTCSKPRPAICSALSAHITQLLGIERWRDQPNAVPGSPQNASNPSPRQTRRPCADHTSEHSRRPRRFGSLCGPAPAIGERGRREQPVPCEVETNLVALLVPACVFHEQGDLDAVVDVEL